MQKINNIAITIVVSTILGFIYFLNVYDFLIGYDSNTYVIESLKYISNHDIKGIQNFAQETGLYIYIVELSRMTGITEPIKIYKITLCLILLIQGLLIYIILGNNKRTFQAFWICIFLLSIISINHTYLFIFRQYISSIFLFLGVWAIENNELTKRKIFFLGYILGVLLFFHKGTSFIYSIIIGCYFLTYSVEKKAIKKTVFGFITVFFIGILIYTPYLVEHKKVFFKTIEDFFVMSTDTVQGPYVKGQGVSLITGANTPFKENILNKIFFNPFFGVIWIIFISQAGAIWKKSVQKRVWVVTSTIFIIFYAAGANFSQRTMYILFFIVCLIIKKYGNFGKKNTIIAVLIISATLTTSTITIGQKKPNLRFRDSLVIEFIKKVPVENSIIVSPGGNNNIPGQLGYLFWEYMYNFSEEIQRNKEILIGNFERDLLTSGHSKNIPIPDAIKNKNIYIVIGSGADGLKYNSSQVIESSKWDNSSYAEKIISGGKSVGHPLRNVYLYKPNYVSEIFSE